MARVPRGSIVLRMISLPNFEDHLGLAAHAKHAAYKAERAGDLDAAWRLHHERRDHYLKHAKRQRFTTVQTIALDAVVAEDLANILRKEGRHLDAFVEILYWAAAQRDRQIKRHVTKVRAYFSRSNIKSVTIDGVEVFISGSPAPDLQTVRNAVRAWAAMKRP